MCAQNGTAPQTFIEQITDALQFYSAKRKASKKPTKRDVERQFTKVEKTAQTLIEAMTMATEKYGYMLYEAYEDTLPDHMSNGDFEQKAMGTEYEGMAFHEVQIYRLQTRLGTLIEAAKNAPKYIDTEKGRPKLNFHLESTLRNLGCVYSEATGREPMDGYSYKSIEGTYHGPFLEFATYILWSYAGKNIPNQTAIGDAAREAFGLRK